MARAGYRRSTAGTGHGQGAWPVLCLLVVAVVAPTACVLWFMTQAMRNERLAVRQTLTEVYRGQLVSARGELEAYWQEKADRLADAESEVEARPTVVFARLVRKGVCHSVIVCDAEGRVRYPGELPPMIDGQAAETTEWAQARRLEHALADPAAAAEAYAAIAAGEPDKHVAARALQAQARCLANAGRTEAAIDILARTLAEDRYHDAASPEGRLVVPGAQLRALQLIGDAADPLYQRTLDALVRQVSDYRDLALPASQRRFLMHQLQTAVPGCPPLPTLAAEDLAAEFLEGFSPSTRPAGGSVAPIDVSSATSPAEAVVESGSRKLWQFASREARLIALFERGRLVAEMQSLAAKSVSVSDVRVELLEPETPEPEPDPFLSSPAGPSLPDWKLALYLQVDDPFSEATDRRVGLYLWTGILVIGATAALALLVGRYVTRQMKLTRLKNDLVATVSHELKTPLASMRLLVDTLLEGNYRDEQQVREYLELTAKENERLSHLIDNFLTFSRMERNKRVFEFADVAVAELVHAATEAVRERFAGAGCRFDVEVADALPTIIGDRDALVTVLLNLLDNALKYTGDRKHVILRARAADGQVRLEVADNGIGLSRRAARRVFDRFYQVDRTLSRRPGGCGLGLSIVKFIVESHGGTIDVRSELGKGSTFVVILPGAPNAE